MDVSESTEMKQSGAALFLPHFANGPMFVANLQVPIHIYSKRRAICSSKTQSSRPPTGQMRLDPS